MKNESIRKVINVDKPNYSTVWSFKQEDDGVLRLSLFKGSTALDITGQTIKLGVLRADKTLVELEDQSCFRINNNELDITLKNNILSIPGIAECDLTLTDASGKMTTASFFVEVKKKTTGMVNILATNLIEGLEKLKNDFKSSGDKLISAFSKEYESLKRIIIDENQAANLQDQVNQTNAQLDTIETQKATRQELDVERKRMDSFTRLAEGSTTGDAELIDGRIGLNGVKYINLGNALRCQLDEIVTLPANVWSYGDIEISYLQGQTWVKGDYELKSLVIGEKYKVKITKVENNSNVIIGRIIFLNSLDVEIKGMVIPTENIYVEFELPENTVRTILRFQAVGETPAISENIAKYKEIVVFNSKAKPSLKNEVLVPNLDKAVETSKCFKYSNNFWKYGDVDISYLEGQTYIYKDYKVDLPTGAYKFKIGESINHNDIKNFGNIILKSNDIEISRTKIDGSDKWIYFDVASDTIDVTIRIQTLIETPSPSTSTAIYKNMYILKSDEEILKLSEDVEIPQINKIENEINKTRNTNKWISVESASLNNNSMTLEPNNIVKNKTYIFNCNINSFSKIRVGHGKNAYGSYFIEIDNSKIDVYAFTTTETKVATLNHNLSISEFVNIILSVGNKGKAKVIIITSTGTFESNEFEFRGCNGNIFAESIGSNLTNCKLSYNCKDYDKKIYAFGDSYFATHWDARWTYNIINWGYDNFLMDAYAGRNSQKAYESFLLAIEHGNPKYALWCMGMNDPDTENSINSDYQIATNNFISKCREREIEPILCTIPNVRGGIVDDSNISQIRKHNFKNDWIRSSGYRYIDFSKCVNADNDNNWYSGMLDNDGVHSTTLGAKTLASQALIDFPELAIV